MAPSSPKTARLTTLAIRSVMPPRARSACPSGKTPQSAAAVFPVKIRQDVAPHHFDDAQDFRRFYAGPAHAEDKIVRVEPPDPLFDLLDDLVRRAQNEAVARQILEWHPEALLARQCHVLAPFGIGGVFGFEKWARRFDRLLVRRRDMQFERHRARRRHRVIGLGERLFIALPLP